MGLILPEYYDPRLDVRTTQEAIKYIRDTFQKELGKEMNLERISAPLFVSKSSGLNDNLNGVERPVQFDMAGIEGETMEVVHSLAKWKRMALHEYGFKEEDVKAFALSVDANQQRLITNSYRPWSIELSERVYKECF